jgi:UDP-N-acetylmuramate dehydrogenase
MNASLFKPGLIDRLPQVQGKLTALAPLKNGSWFQAGGPAEVLFQPADVHDLAAFLKACPEDVPLTILGVGSNTLIRDGGIAGVVIRLGARLAQITIENDVITAGGGALDFNISRAARDAGLTGLEFLSGIPGSLGGALTMNAGAYGSEMKNILIDATLVLRDGALKTLSVDELGMSYRKTNVPEGGIIVSARLRGAAGDGEAIAEKMKQIAASRAEAQPQRVKTGGSTFANPEGQKAWELIDKAGCRGLRIGDAMMSDKHCNFMLNLGSATAADLEALGEEVRRRVLETSGIELRWEIKRIGLPLPQGDAA